MKDKKYDLTPLYLFAGGLLFYTVAMPWIDSANNVFQLACNTLVTKWQTKLNEAAAEPDVNVNAIGFQIPSEEDEEDYE